MLFFSQLQQNYLDVSLIHLTFSIKKIKNRGKLPKQDPYTILVLIYFKKTR